MGRGFRGSGGGAMFEEDPLAYGSRPKRRRLIAGAESADAGRGGESKRAMYHCNYCEKDISSSVRIKCAQCTDFDLCLECFSVGVEITPHKNDHKYRVMENLDFPLLHPAWNADEEILLLEAVEIYGLGNWPEVAEHVGTKNKTECYEHYFNTYILSPTSPLPDMSQVLGKSKAEMAALLPKEEAEPAPVKEELPGPPPQLKLEEPKEETGAEEGVLTPSAAGDSQATETGGKSKTRRTPGNEAAKTAQGGAKKMATGGKEKAEKAVVVKEEGAEGKPAEEGHTSTRSIGIKKPKPSEAEVKVEHSGEMAIAYNAKREEFDPEYDNEAELPLADMEFKDSDTDVERQLKIRMLQIYGHRLDERARRRAFILERGLLNLKKQQALDRKRSKEERELYARARVFAKYCTPGEVEALVVGLIAERRVRARIEELKEWRGSGIRTLAEAEVYEADKRRRDQDAQAKRQREAAAYLYSNRSNQRANRYLNRDRGGFLSDGDNPAFYLAGARELQKLRASAPSLPSTSTGGATQSSGGGVPPPPLVIVSGASKGGKKQAAPLEVRWHPGVDLLSRGERELCEQVRLLPLHYLKMKDELMRESAAKGSVSLDYARDLFKVDAAKVLQVYQLLLSKEWIVAPSTEQEELPNRKAAAPPGSGEKASAQDPPGGVEAENAPQGRSSAEAQQVQGPEKGSLHQQLTKEPQTMQGDCKPG